MKKGIFKYFAALLPLFVIPFALTTTSCNGFNSAQLKSLNSWTKDSENPFHGFGDYGRTSTISKKFYSLYFGYSGLNGGNYVIFLGDTGVEAVTPPSSFDGNTDTQFTINPGLKIFSNQTWSAEDSTDINKLSCDDESDFVNGVNNWYNDVQPNYKINFYSYFEDSRKMNYGNGAKVDSDKQQALNELEFYPNPFYTWTEKDFLNPQFNPTGSQSDETSKDKNDWEKHHKIGSYARNDAAATQYRSLFERLWTLSPQTFNGKKGEDTILGLYYKKGRAQLLGKYDSTNTNAIYSDLKETYPDPKIK